MRAIVEAAARNSGAALSGGEVAPTNQAAVLSPRGRLTVMRWGFPRWDGKGQVINARSETAGEKAMFRDCLRTGRCLIPASWYYEWEKRGAERVRYALRPPETPVLWLAGLCRRDPAAGEDRFVILTRPAAPGLAFLHDRMPVILPGESRRTWLRGGDPLSALAEADEELLYKTG